MVPARREDVAVRLRSFGPVLPGVNYRPRPGGYAVILRGGAQVAVVETPWRVYLPGGGIDPGETAEAAAVREAREECGLAIALGDRIGAALEFARDDATERYWRKECSFFVARVQDEGLDGVEADHTLHWVTPAEALTRLAHGSARWAVAEAVRRRIDVPGVRAVGDDDRDAWLSDRTALWPDGATTHADEIDRYLEQGRAPGMDAVFVAVDAQDAPVGFAEVAVRSHAEGTDSDCVGYLEGWYVRPGARQRGHGRSLVAAALRWARAMGCGAFASDTEVENVASAAAHRALGFEEVAAVRLFVRGLDDVPGPAA